MCIEVPKFIGSPTFYLVNDPPVRDERGVEPVIGMVWYELVLVWYIPPRPGMVWGQLNTMVLPVYQIIPVTLSSLRQVADLEHPDWLK